MTIMAIIIIITIIGKLNAGIQIQQDLNLISFDGPMHIKIASSKSLNVLAKFYQPCP